MFVLVDMSFGWRGKKLTTQSSEMHRYSELLLAPQMERRGRFNQDRRKKTHKTEEKDSLPLNLFYFIFSSISVEQRSTKKRRETSFFSYICRRCRSVQQFISVSVSFVYSNLIFLWNVFQFSWRIAGPLEWIDFVHVEEGFLRSFILDFFVLWFFRGIFKIVDGFDGCVFYNIFREEEEMCRWRMMKDVKREKSRTTRIESVEFQFVLRFVAKIIGS